MSRPVEPHNVGPVTCRRCRRTVNRLARRVPLEVSRLISAVPAGMSGLRCRSCRRVFVVVVP